MDNALGLAVLVRNLPGDRGAGKDAQYSMVALIREAIVGQSAGCEDANGIRAAFG